MFCVKTDSFIFGESCVGKRISIRSVCGGVNRQAGHRVVKVTGLIGGILQSMKFSPAVRQSIVPSNKSKSWCSSRNCLAHICSLVHARAMVYTTRLQTAISPRNLLGILVYDRCARHNYGTRARASLQDQS